MTLHCPSCDEELEFDFDPRGQTFDCPACNYRFTVPKVLKATAAKPVRRAAPAKKVDKTLHYILGLLLGPFGIMVSAMVDKEGVSYAVRGFIINFAICLGLLLIASTAGFAL